MWYSNLQKNIYFSTYHPPTFWYTCPIALPVHRNPQHRSLLTVVSAITAPPFQSLLHQRNVYIKVEPFYATNTSQHKQETFIYEYPLHWVLLPIKTYDRNLLFGNTLLMHGRNFDYWIQPLNMRMSVYYLNCHAARLCCYLIMHIENLLHPLQLFYFYLRPIYWLPFVPGYHHIYRHGHATSNLLFTEHSVIIFFRYTI
jgi:hypothetical protein